MLSSADFLIAEVTTPSLGVGYEIAFAIQLQKRIICLFRHKKGVRLSAMIAGCPDITVVKYDTLKEVKKAIDLFLKEKWY